MASHYAAGYPGRFRRHHSSTSQTILASWVGVTSDNCTNVMQAFGQRTKANLCYQVAFVCCLHNHFNPNQPLDYYAQTNSLFVICLSVFRLQWNPIAPSKRRDICSKTRVVIIITLMTDLGLTIQQITVVYLRWTHCVHDTLVLTKL